MSLVKAKQLAEEAVAECNRMKCNDHRELKFICEVGARESLRKAIADARAEGYRAGIEAAAKVVTRLADQAWSVGEVKEMERVANAIRSLTPAAKTEETK